MINVTKSEDLWCATIDRLGKSNSLTLDLLDDLEVAVDAAARDRTIRLFILTGAGERTFCAGADLGEVRAIGAEDIQARWYTLFGKISRLPCMTLADINGAVIGGGMLLALACDVRISDERARFANPALQIGVLPNDLIFRKISSLTGPGRASLIMLGGLKVDAGQAYEWGLTDLIADGTQRQQIIEQIRAYARSASRELLTAMKSRLLSISGIG